MRKIRPRLLNLGLGLASGVLLGLPFLVRGLWWLHYVALVPWVLLLTRREVSLSWLHFLAGAFVFFSMALSPFALFHQTVPYALAVFYAPFMLPFAILLRRIHLRFPIPLTLLVPVVWVAGEWLRLRFSIGQVAIFPLGTSQFRQLELIQIADLTGVAGVSFLIACASGAVADVFLRGTRSWKDLWPVGAFLLFLSLVYSYGIYRNAAQHELLDGPRLALIQPGVTHYRDPDKAEATFREQLEFTRSEVESSEVDLIVLPENTVSVPIGDDPSYLEELGRLAREQRSRVVVGAFSRASLAPPRVYTSAYYLSQDGEPLARYHKLHLIPWAEYMPFGSWLPRLSPALDRAHYALTNKLLGYVSNGVPGRELVLFSIPDGGRDLRFAVPICFEVASSGFGREVVEQGADFLLNITSEGVFGPPIYWHMLAHSVFRAVENRVSVARAGNNGISGIIEPGGRIRSLVEGNETGRPYLEAGSLVDRVPIAVRTGSFYSRHGELFSHLCLVGSLVLFGLSFWPRIRLSESRAAGT